MVGVPSSTDPLGEGTFLSKIGDSLNPKDQLLAWPGSWFSEGYAPQDNSNQHPGGAMNKRLILKQTSRHAITSILEKLRSEGIKTLAGGMVDSEAMILVEETDVARAVYLLATIRVEAQIG